MPIFHDGELVAFACCMAHWLDVGGTLGGVTTDIYSEGMQIPIVKYQQAPAWSTRTWSTSSRMNVPPAGARDGRSARADHGGDHRRAALPRTGRPLRPRRRCSASIARRSWTRPRRRRAPTRARIPDGVYEAESFMDDDGVEIGKRVPIRVQVERARATR